jgi:hypothetical protein
MYFTIYQTIARDERRPGLYREYPQDFFDLIIIDERHRESDHPSIDGADSELRLWPMWRCLKNENKFSLNASSHFLASAPNSSVAGSHCHQDKQSEADQYDDADNHPAGPVEVLLLGSLRFGSD